MKYKGINYDVGTTTTTGRTTRPVFETDIVAREIDIIKNELHCNAIRISGISIERVAIAAEIALKAGLTIWFAPSLTYNNQDNTIKFITDAAKAAEALRLKFSNMVFVLGCELTLFTAGFVDGFTAEERMKHLFSPVSLLLNAIGLRRGYNRRLNKFLLKSIVEVRKVYHGPITYASGAWEKVDWQIFDMIGVDYYRSVFNEKTFLKQLQQYTKLGKPLCIMEFGCCSFKGAAEKGAMGWAIADWKKEIPAIKGNHTRDEQVQSDYIISLLEIFNGEAVHAAFVFTFVMYSYYHDHRPAYDMDMASFGIVKVTGNEDQDEYRGLPWLPKKAFYALARFYSAHQ